ncbi:Putative glycoside hydrolase family 18, catalytic domain, glycosyl hydrolase family 18 (GH18) active [Colletotrichum destructivum]|uniref:Glycoside hydrolase family 18, catalytic domain, glycosyl hydrolase family 18 (GH18) active n=1 Tax=Colletotrichum destructivum TaxID=34406 RepID=A0AAX4J403_9PEZI|nr:Putative glycoside hydrolase family 18, catalytic domain, glycosyl hydrolase family 18 (GH18) active [Colletotrichum destructivum]
MYQGKLPNPRPKEDANGYCAIYTTKQDDYCSKIAAGLMLTIEELETFNKNTWSWNGCKLLYPKFNMCVSKSAAPMPAIVPLNPCPVNVCCNIWGQCGLMDDFCVVSRSETGAPGTAAPGKHGCISNCGRDIIKGPAPAKKVKLGYFEGWNFNRECLTMVASQINTDAYTHVHFAFPNVTRGDFRIEITDALVQEQFEYFKKLEGVKNIPANRDVFKRNIISFINKHNMDGIDLDWEYPSAPDIPGIPSDDPINGVNYYRLLASIKAEVGSSKSVSFAAPASY